ncbi:NAD(P)H-dependent oxidoreductase subunit E [Nocardioides sp.]|uniref:NAD(P)H-dependent oxidoreductase subunit E n=1 Tax=Nocardioides sp. TaxID=35761 RepID=UPI003528A545
MDVAAATLVAPTLLAVHGRDRSRLLDILWELQRRHGHLPEAELAAVAEGLGTTLGDVRQTASFYHLFRQRPAGRHVLYLADTVLARMHGYADVLAALEQETGAPLGGIDPTGTFGLRSTPCLGLSDQEPAMLLDDVVFTRLTPARVSEIVGGLRDGRTPREIANPDGIPTHLREYVDALVETNVRTHGPVFFRPRTDVAEIIREAVSRPPETLRERVSLSGLRGRGGAGFDTGLKWKLTATTPADIRYVVCNADEGEPGTFKDRVLLTRQPELVIAGMVLAAYAVGARHGIIYLRGEYAYLRHYLAHQLHELREHGALGTDIGGRAGFDFDIRIQLGAGAYVCGEESALLESCEGKRGTPRLKPPFPAQVGFQGHPTIVDNVETFAVVTRVLEEGPEWFSRMGTEDSAGTRLLSVAGDCEIPGVHEVAWGTTLHDVLTRVGAPDAHAVQVSGPAGELVSVARNGHRRLAYEDLGCNGAFTVFDASRDLLDIARQHLRFFVGESCGICVPCRAGNPALLQLSDRIAVGHADAADLEHVQSWAALLRGTSRCGLGVSSSKPLTTTLREFPELATAAPESALLASFDEDAAVSAYAPMAADLTRTRAEAAHTEGAEA